MSYFLKALFAFYTNNIRFYYFFVKRFDPVFLKKIFNFKKIFHLRYLIFKF